MSRIHKLDPSYNPIVYQLKVTFRDVYEQLPKEIQRKFESLGRSQQRYIARSFAGKIGKEIEKELFLNTNGLVRVAIHLSGLLEAIDKEFLETLDDYTKRPFKEDNNNGQSDNSSDRRIQSVNR